MLKWSDMIPSVASAPSPQLERKCFHRRFKGNILYISYTCLAGKGTISWKKNIYLGIAWMETNHRHSSSWQGGKRMRGWGRDEWKGTHHLSHVDLFSSSLLHLSFGYFSSHWHMYDEKTYISVGSEGRRDRSIRDKEGGGGGGGNYPAFQEPMSLDQQIWPRKFVICG